MESFIQNYGYFALIVLSIASSACIPVPSEITYIIAGAACTTAVTGHVEFSLWAVIVVCSLSSLVGAQIAYEVGRYAGRPIVERWGKWILVSPKDVDASQRWFEKYGPVTVLVSRVVPFVRSFVSLPAGIAEMKRTVFAVLTLIGSTVWVVILTLLGYAAGKNWHRVSGDFHDAQWPTIIVVVLLLALGFWHRLRSVRRANAS
jgi:membrane protein DedA with SNARE-associated domain